MQPDNHPSVERLADLQEFVTNFSKILRVPQLGDTGDLKMTLTTATA